MRGRVETFTTLGTDAAGDPEPWTWLRVVSNVDGHTAALQVAFTPDELVAVTRALMREREQAGGRG